MKKPSLTIGDWTLVVFFAALAAASFVLVPRLLHMGGSNVEVVVRGNDVGKFPLDRDRTVKAAGPLGTTVIRIERGRARILSSPCPNKHCMRMGDVGKEGGILICIPNEVLVRVGNGTADEIDAVSQ